MPKKKVKKMDEDTSPISKDGRANRAVLAFLKKALGAPAVHLEKGNRSRRKSVVVAGLAPDAASRRLADLLEH